MEKLPLVSVGIPTYNRPDGLRRTLECITQQTYKNLEIIVSDNCSPNEDVQKVIKEFAGHDTRMLSFRQQENIGANNNFNFVLKQANGKYFIWVADDDFCKSNYIEELVNLSSTDEAIVLCGSDINVIDDKNNILRTERLEEIYPQKKWSIELFFSLPISNIFFSIYGLYKTEVLKKLYPHNWTSYKDYLTNSEIPFLAKVALQGRIVAVPKLLKDYYTHPNSQYVKEIPILTPNEFAKLRYHIRKRLVITALTSPTSLKVKYKLLKQIYSSSVEGAKYYPMPNQTRQGSIMFIKKFFFAFLKLSLSSLLPKFLERKLISTAFYLATKKKYLLPHFQALLNATTIINEKQASDIQIDRKLLIEVAENFPSVVNNGYRHIEKVIDLVYFFELNPAASIVDVGGADGVIAKKFAAQFPNAKVYTFEPIKTTFQELLNTISGHQNIHGINKGLGAEKIEYATIHRLARVTSSSLFPAKTVISNSFFAENLKNESVEDVSITTLDDEIPSDEQINILKVDVQGYEVEVLKGAKHTLRRVKLLVLEMQNHDLYEGAPKYFELDEFVRKEDFILYDIVPSIRQDKQLYEWDAIYVNKKVLPKHDNAIHNNQGFHRAKCD
jgi:FkbM family methyltransferase